MDVLVVLVARHRLALRTFEKEGGSLLDVGRVPLSIVDRIRFHPCIYDPGQAGGISFGQFVLNGGSYDQKRGSVNIDGVVALYEDSLTEIFLGVRDAIFAAAVPAIGYVNNIKNFLIEKYRILLGNYGELISQIQDGNRYHAASLPIRNFDADEFRELIDVCRGRSLDKTFPNDLDSRLNRLMRLRGPKRRSSYPHIYFQDSCERYFRFGHEVHSRYETGGAHEVVCAVNGRYRFGGALDQERHFNVTVGDSDRKTPISCSLPNCHGEVVTVKGRTHINMFSNDFHK